MNREIKFSAWQKWHEYMFTPDYIDFINGNIIIGEHDGDSRYEDIPLMQYTGLKDKNGKEIYEGDVLSNSTGKIDKVIFYENGFFGKSKSNMGKNHYWYNPLCADYIKNKEVIGNIYENPELLKK